MGAIAESLKRELAAPEPDFAEGYAESFLNTWIAAQIKVLRLQRDMTQERLAALLATSQTVVSRIENVNYSAWNIGTLKKLARAFDVRLTVSFEEYGSLPEEVESFSESVLRKDRRTQDRNLIHKCATPTQSRIEPKQEPAAHIFLVPNGNANSGDGARHMWENGDYSGKISVGSAINESRVTREATA